MSPPRCGEMLAAHYTDDRGVVLDSRAWLITRRASGRGSAYGAFGTGCVLVPVELNRRGRRLLSRPGGARVLVSLSGRNVPHLRWMIQPAVA